MVEKPQVLARTPCFYGLLFEPEAPPQKGMDSIAMGY
jgi:hypothetical protein